MHYTKIPAREANIATQGLDSLVKHPFEIQVSGDSGLFLKGMVCRRKDEKATYYYQEKTSKERIVIHFTAGNLGGDLATLMGELHVSVPFVIARDGTIYQLFDPSFWSYHLGPDALGGNKNQSSRTIGIELSNYGPLKKNGNKLETVYSSASKRDAYCSVEDKDQYLNVVEPFRGYSYFTNFTDEQYDSLVMLLRHLTNEYGIPREFLQVEERFRTSNAVLIHKGIVSHVNYRSSGKWDIGPAFDWDRVVTGVQMQSFKPLTPRERRINKKRQEIEAEEKIMAQLQMKIDGLKAELSEIEEESEPPVTRGQFIQTGILSQEEANAIYRSDIPVTEDHGEEYLEPGYALK